MIEFLIQTLRFIGWAYVYVALGFLVIFIAYILIMPWLPDKEDWE